MRRFTLGLIVLAIIALAAGRIVTLAAIAVFSAACALAVRGRVKP